MFAWVFVVVPLWSCGATAAMVSVANPLGSPQGDGGFNPTLPVADRTIVPTLSSHHPTPRHYKPVRHNNRQGQQYYQPSRQYYQWQVH
jgi:hypothetical protein